MKKLITITAAFTLPLCGLVFWRERADVEALKIPFRTESHEAAFEQSEVIQNSFRQTYQAIRTIARLPGIRSIDSRTREISSDAHETIQEIYNNLASNVAISEIYIVPVTFEPDSIDATTGEPQRPLLEFDNIIIGKNADSDVESAHDHSSVPEIEIFEHRAIKDQLRWFSTHVPDETSTSYLQYPALLSPEVLTCDNTRYSPSHPNDHDRSGLVYSVPFYGTNGELKGSVTAVMLTGIFQDLITQPYFAIRNLNTGYIVAPHGTDASLFPRQDFANTEPKRGHIYSERFPLNISDNTGNWILLANMPNSLFWNRDDVQKIYVFSYYAYGALLLFALLLLRVFAYRARLQKTAEAVLQVAADAVVLFDAREEIRDINGNAQQLFGYSAKELHRQSLFMLFHVSSHDQVKQLLSANTETDFVQSKIAYQEVSAQKNDGSIFPIEIAVSVLSQGSLPLRCLVIRDLTERKILETQRRQTQKLESIGQLAAGVAHEINTPIQYVGSNSRFLQEEFTQMQDLLKHCVTLSATDPAVVADSAALRQVVDTTKQLDIPYLVEEIPKALRDSLEGIARVTRIVKAMKEFAHPGKGEKQIIDINRAIESTVVISTNEWKYVAEMETDFDPHLPLTPCLPNEFNQVILNLLVNSAHAIADVRDRSSEEKGVIRVRTRNLGTSIEIQIQDSGAGIPDDIAEKVFDPFFTTKEVGKGTGQGLALARSVVVNKLGGTIRFESEAGKGTTFFIQLPTQSV